MWKIQILTVLSLLLVACSPEKPAQTDLQLLQNFHKQIWTKNNDLEAAVADYQSESAAALKAGDNIALYQAASRLDGRAQAVATETLTWSAPTFQNKAVQERMSDALEQLKQRALMIQTSASAIAQMADTGRLRPSLVTAAQSATAQADAATGAMVMDFVQSYQVLGIDIDQIDDKIGGLKQKRK